MANMTVDNSHPHNPHTCVYTGVSENREGLLKNLTVLKDVRAIIWENTHNALDAEG